MILGRAAGENFTVASRLLPRSTRHHLMAFYGYARLADYLGDEFEGDRLAALNWLEAETRRASEDPHDAPLHPLVAQGVTSARELGLDTSPFFDLISANVADQTVTRYATFEDLLGYCHLSANPVGRLVLGVFGYQDPAYLAWSDAICTGLQLAEHWHDVGEDARAGRIYLPTADLERFGVAPDELTTAGPASVAWRALMVFEVSRARRCLEEGAPLLGRLTGRAKWAVAGFWAGGQAALDGIAARRFDVSGPTARPRVARVAVHLGRALTGAGG